MHAIRQVGTWITNLMFWFNQNEKNRECKLHKHFFGDCWNFFLLICLLDFIATYLQKGSRTYLIEAQQKQFLPVWQNYKLYYLGSTQYSLVLLSAAFKVIHSLRKKYFKRRTSQLILFPPMYGQRSSTS